MFTLTKVGLKRLVLPITGDINWSVLDFELSGKTRIKALENQESAYTDVVFDKSNG